MIKPYYENEHGVLYHGDCLEVMQELDISEYALLTDPPYGENLNLQRSCENITCPDRVLKGLNLQRRDWPTANDKKTVDPSTLLKFNQMIIWGGNYIADKLPPSRCWVIWDKLHIPPDNHHDCEMAWTNLSGVTRIHRQLWRGICREGEENIANGPKLHPYQKPIKLMKFCINLFSKKTNIFDPFAGSCSIAISAQALDRKWVSIELSEQYCEIAAKRIDAHSKQYSILDKLYCYSDKGDSMTKDLKSLTLRIPAETHKQLKIISLFEEKTISKVIEEIADNRFKKAGYLITGTNGEQKD